MMETNQTNNDAYGENDIEDRENLEELDQYRLDREAYLQTSLNPNRYTYYLRHAYREMKKRKFNFCLGMCSILIVVLVAAICYTLLAKAPAVFLQNAESFYGQVDLRIFASEESESQFLNYTLLSERTASIPDYALHSPRSKIAVKLFGSTCVNTIESFQLNPFQINWKYMGPTPDNPMSPCTYSSVDCLESLCEDTNSEDLPTLVLLDSQKELRMKLGRSWSHPPIPKGSALVSSDIAATYGIQKGSVFFISLPYPSYPVLEPLSDRGYRALAMRNQNVSVFGANETYLMNVAATRFTSYVNFAVTALDIISSTTGKLGESEDAILMEYSHFYETYLENLHPALHEKNTSRLLELTDPDQSNAQLQSATYSQPLLPNSIAELASYPISKSDFYSFAKEIVVNMPNPRTRVYMDSNYDNIQNAVIDWSSKAIYYFGFPDFEAELQTLEGVNDTKFFSLFLGLILSIILTILFILSTMLIYSLLIISIETRTFEMGIHRMVGMSRVNLVTMLLIQALSFAIPAWALGLIVSQGLTARIIGRMENAVDVPLSKLLTPRAVGVSTFLGLFIPLVSALLPIRSALNQNLHDTLDTKHSKTQGVKFSIERSEDGSISAAWLLVGLGLSVFGFLIYYLLPLSLLSFNLELFFNIFFALLIGMLFGLILLSLNIEPFLERIVIFLFFWWETPSLPTVVHKNLIAHRVRNRKTTIMYSLSLGFIIFITVAYQMEIITSQLRTLKRHGAYFVLESGGKDASFNSFYVSQFEAIVSSSPVVENYAWVTDRMGLTENNDSYSQLYITNIGHAYEFKTRIYGVSSSFFETADSDFTIPSIRDNSNGLSMSEQLYTIRGSQSAILGTSWKQAIGLNSLDKDSSFLFALQKAKSSIRGATLSLFHFKPMAILDSCPRITISRFPSDIIPQPVMVSLPTYVALSGGEYKSVADLNFGALLMKLKPGVSEGDLDALKQTLKMKMRYIPSAKLFDMRDYQGSLQKAETIMTLIFSVATYIAMFLCLFSLMASMYTNIFEQSKEIAVVRAIGLRSSQIVRVYIYEAFTLTFSASILGIMIGVIMGWTMTAQRVLFTQLPVNFVFPYTLFALVFVGSIICALLSSYFPARVLLEKPIASVFRTVL